jgi:DNA-binding response OmpR family regulator
MRILLVEDEPEMAEALRVALKKHGMLADVVTNLTQAMAALRSAIARWRWRQPDPGGS